MRPSGVKCFAKSSPVIETRGSILRLGQSPRGPSRHSRRPMRQVRIDKLAAHQMERRLVIEADVVERICNDLQQPYHPCLRILEEEQMHGSEDEPAKADNEPYPRRVIYEGPPSRRRREDAEQRGVEKQHHRRGAPDREQDALASEVVADLDRLLVLVRRLVNLVVSLGLEEEVADLAAQHGYQPTDQGGCDRIREKKHVAREEAQRAYQVQRLIDSAVMIVPVVVPTLNTKSRQHILHFRLRG